MSSNENRSEQNERAHLDAAWERLQEKLKDKPAGRQWTQWAEKEYGKERVWSESGIETVVLPKVEKQPELNGTVSASKPSIPSSLTRWKRNKYSKWINGAVAAGVLAIVIVSPAGNKALASILGQFRMEQMAVIQADEAEQLFNSFFPDGKVHESVNRFGTFSRQMGTLQGQYDAAEISKKLNRNILVPKGFDSKIVHVGPSDALTLTMNVDEINQAMSRLGASKLLPESIDGKPVTIRLGESVHMNIEKGNKHATFLQIPVPVIDVDPSMDVKEAMEAVIDFPLMPRHLKDRLESSSILNGGAVPLPIIAEGETKMIQVEGYDVILKKDRHDHGYYSAMWIKDGIIYELSGNLFANQQEVEAKVSELIRS